MGYEAKKESNRIRRENWNRGIRNALADTGSGATSKLNVVRPFWSLGYTT
jgi:hypothetical protein